jgi:hypothetical protein
MAIKPAPLTGEEFASLLAVGATSTVTDPPAVIPAEHSARLIALGYMADLAGRLRMTGPGRRRIAAGFENRPSRFASNIAGFTTLKTKKRFREKIPKQKEPVAPVRVCHSRDSARKGSDGRVPGRRSSDRRDSGCHGRNSF